MDTVSLDDLVLHPKVWRGAGDDFRLDAVSTGFVDLDRQLPGGGWPQNAITEIFVDRHGIGELSLLMPALAGLTKEAIIWVAPPYIPYAPALARFGLDLEQMLLVDPMSTGTGLNALWALEQVLRSQSKVTVLAWIESANTAVLRRLQLAVEEHGCWAILFRPSTALEQRSPAALRLQLSRKNNNFQIEILKCRGGRPALVNLDLPVFSERSSNYRPDSGTYIGPGGAG